MTMSKLRGWVDVTPSSLLRTSEVKFVWKDVYSSEAFGTGVIYKNDVSIGSVGVSRTGRRTPWWLVVSTFHVLLRRTFESGIALRSSGVWKTCVMDSLHI
jgi:hypothetical protein